MPRNSKLGEPINLFELGGVVIMIFTNHQNLYNT